MFDALQDQPWAVREAVYDGHLVEVLMSPEWVDRHEVPAEIIERAKDGLR